MSTTKTAAQAQFASRTPAQQAALDAARLAKKVAAEQAAAPLTAPTALPDAQPVVEDEATMLQRLAARRDQAMSAITALFPDAAEGACSTKRWLCGFVASLMASAAVSFIGTTLLNYAVYAMCATGSLGLVYLTIFVGMALILLAAIYAGNKAGQYIKSGAIDQTWANIKGIFSRKGKPA